MNQADVAKLVSKLRFAITPKHRRFPNRGGSQGRLNLMKETVTALIKYERIELNYARADEARGYAERLISDAIRHGDTHKPTMDFADYYINEKQYVHKLFKVLAPRFQDSPVSYTRMYKAPQNYPGIERKRAVLELRGNPYPPLKPDLTINRNFIHNVLLAEAKKAYRRKKYAELAADTTQANDEKLSPIEEVTEKMEKLETSESNKQNKAAEKPTDDSSKEGK